MEDVIRQIHEECYLSTEKTAKTFFPDRFYLPFSSLHSEIFKVLDDPNLQQVVILAPRGFGKTSIINLALPAKHILYGESRFIVPISNSATSAVLQSENLKHELITNPTVNTLFGEQKTDKWARDRWVTQSGTMVMPRGSGQQVRGLLHGNDRPDLIIVDDLEDSEGVRSEEQRAKLKYWFSADVCNSINRGRKDWRIIVIGTLLHEDSLLANLMEDPAWHTIQLSICDDDYRSNWPDFKTDEEIRQLVEEYRARGELDVFYQEYRNIPISIEDATFSKEFFRYYNEDDEDFVKIKRKLDNAVIVDPAKTVKLHSAESAIVGVGVDTEHHTIYEREIVHGLMNPQELYDQCFAMCERLGSRILAIEVTSLNEFITYPLKNEIRRRALPIQLVELKARAKKEDRIAQLVPLYRQGLVKHNRSNCGALEAQLMSFPRSKRMDIMDAMAYVVELLDIFEKYFDYEEDPSDIEKEYEELNELNERPIPASWRIA